MKSRVLPLNARFFAAALVLLTVALPSMRGKEIAAQVERSDETTAAIHHEFSADDEALLTEIQRGCFAFLWNEVGSPVPLVKDRLTNDKVSSLAGVGFQLTALPIGRRARLDRQTARNPTCQKDPLGHPRAQGQQKAWHLLTLRRFEYRRYALQPRRASTGKHGRSCAPASRRYGRRRLFWRGSQRTDQPAHRTSQLEGL